MRSQRGRLVDEGASGFLEKKLAAEAGNDGEASTSKSGREDDDVWSKVEGILYDDIVPQPGKLMGTPRWAAVYLASTPQQAKEMGLGLPGEDTVCPIFPYQWSSLLLLSFDFGCTKCRLM